MARRKEQSNRKSVRVTRATQKAHLVQKTEVAKRDKGTRKTKHAPQSKSPQDWFQDTVDAFMVNGKRKRTAETYGREVRNFCKWLQRSPQSATEEDLKRFILYRRNDCNLAGSSMRILCVGMRFFFEHVLRRNGPLLKIMKANREQTLPVVLTREEVWRTLNAVRQPQIRAYLQTVYSCGLRLGEGLNLTVHDIDGTRKRLHIRNGKGGKDRLVPLPDATYHLLRNYWKTHRHSRLIFPALGRDRKQGSVAKRPMDTTSVQGGLYRALERAGLRKPGVRMHTLRHGYATHLLEAGVNVHAIQKYLGHATLHTTLRYFHLTSIKQLDHLKIINDLMKGGESWAYAPICFASMRTNISIALVIASQPATARSSTRSARAAPRGPVSTITTAKAAGKSIVSFVAAGIGTVPTASTPRASNGYTKGCNVNCPDRISC